MARLEQPSTGELLLVDPTAGQVSVVLPPAITPGDRVSVKNDSDSANKIRIIALTDDEIDGGREVVLEGARLWAICTVAQRGVWICLRSGVTPCADCAWDCALACKGGCLDTCVEECADDCTYGCLGSCVEVCAEDCSGSCSEVCADDCTGSCTEVCAGGGEGCLECSGSCTEGCGDSCVEACADSCEADCTDGCGTFCSYASH